MNTKNSIKITPSPNQGKIQSANRYHNPLVKRMTSTIGGAVANFGFDTLGAIVGGHINDYYSRKAEQRADARYRDLLRDTPRLIVESRRAAGLNPYGDAVLPGQVAQSTPDTSPVSSGAFSRSRGDTLEEQLAIAKIENDTLVSQATADKLEAEADSLRGNEQRATERFPVELYGLKLANDLTNFEYEQARVKAPLILRQLEADIAYKQQMLANAIKDGTLKEDEHLKMQEEIKNLQVTRANIKAQELLAYSNIKLNDVQLDLFKQQTETEEARTLLTQREARELLYEISGKLQAGSYYDVPKSEQSRLAYELERYERTLWDKPDDEGFMWYVTNFLWNLQNCLTLSGSASTSASTGSRTIIKPK